MIAKLKKHNLYQSALLLCIMSLFCVFLIIVRSVSTGKVQLLFLMWNLFLAFIPWILSALITVLEKRHIIIHYILIVVWLLFFPNAPYILTDLIHLGYFRSAPLWFDLILLLSFAFTGLLYGFESLRNIELIFHFKKRFQGIIVSIVLINIACLGIYIGRFLRWNSWDVVKNFPKLAQDIFDHVAGSENYQTTWGFTFLLGILLSLVYLSYQIAGKRKSSSEK